MQTYKIQSLIIVAVQLTARGLGDVTNKLLDSRPMSKKSVAYQMINERCHHKIE